MLGKENPMSDKYTPCKYSPGMFEGEYAVEITLHGTTVSLFADEDDLIIIDPGSGMGLLRVTIQDEGGDLIALPAETLEQGRRYLRYPINQLRSV